MQDMGDIIGADISGTVETIIGPFVPDTLLQELRTMSLQDLLITVSNQDNGKGGSQYRVSLFETTIKSEISWQPWDQLDLLIEDVYLRVTYDSGFRGSQKTLTKSCGLDLACTAYFGKVGVAAELTLDRSKTGEEVTLAWGLILRETEVGSMAVLSLGDLVTSCASGVGLDLLAIKNDLNRLLTIDIQTLQIMYTTSPSRKSIVFSQRGEQTRILDIPLTVINIICEKEGAGEWSWTVALEAPNFQNPLAKISPLLDLVQVKNLYVAFWKGRCSSSVSKTAPRSSTSFMVAGTLLLGSNPFLQVIKGLIGKPSIDFCVTQHSFRISKTLGSEGLGFFGIFTLLKFNFAVDNEGFALGGDVQLDAQWLSQDETRPGLPRRPILSFDVIAHNTGALGMRLAITSLNQPFGIPGLEVKDLTVTVVILVAEATLESLAIAGTFTIKNTDVLAFIDLETHAVPRPSDHVALEIKNLTLVNVIDALSEGALPSMLKTIGNRINFEDLRLKLTFQAGAFEFYARLYFFGLHGVVKVRVNPAAGFDSGMVCGASLSAVDIFGIVKITSFSSDASGPFIYLNTTLKGDFKAPDDLGVTDEAMLATRGSPFYLTGKLVFLGVGFGIYGRINGDKPGLDLIVRRPDKLNIPGLNVRSEFITTIHMDLETFSLRNQWSLHVDIDVGSLDVLGLGLGSLSIPAFDVACATTYLVRYSGTNWMNDGLVFEVEVSAQIPLLKLDIHATIPIPLTFQSFSDLPGLIEDFFKDIIASEIKNMFNIFGQGLEKAKEAAIATARILNEGFNIAKDEIVSAFVGAFHDVEEGLKIVGTVCAEALAYSAYEVASTFTQLGCTAAEIAGTLADVYGATAPEIASALIFAGHTAEVVFEAAFNEGAGALVKGVDIVGSNITSGIVDAGIAIEGW
jgi:hypothetical protein